MFKSHGISHTYSTQCKCCGNWWWPHGPGSWLWHWSICLEACVATLAWWLPHHPFWQHGCWDHKPWAFQFPMLFHPPWLCRWLALHSWWAWGPVLYLCGTFSSWHGGMPCLHWATPFLLQNHYAFCFSKVLLLPLLLLLILFAACPFLLISLVHL